MHTLDMTSDADALCRRAAQLLDAGRVDAARSLWAACQALQPRSADLSLLGIRISLNDQAWEQAFDDLDRALASSPAHQGLRKCRADLRQKIGDYEGAARDAAEAVVLNPRDAHAKVILGQAMLGILRIDDAVSCFLDAVADAPTNPEYREFLSSTLEKANNGTAALQVLVDGIALIPSSISIRNAAILICIRQRSFGRAVQFAEGAAESGLADACTFGMKGHALSSLGRHEEAAEAYKEAFKLGPEDPYVRHLVVSAGALPDSNRAPEGYIRTVFDGYADRFESHLASLRYKIPDYIRSLFEQHHPQIVGGLSVGPVLDLGCGTGMVARALEGLEIGPFTGIDLSTRMLAHAKAKCLYEELREGDILTELSKNTQQWPAIVAADVFCYFGDIQELLTLVRPSLQPAGWLVFSVEKLELDAEGIAPGNGNWALLRQGRYVHSENYVYSAVTAAGLSVLRAERIIIREEGGAGVRGLILVVGHAPYYH